MEEAKEEEGKSLVSKNFFGCVAPSTARTQDYLLYAIPMLDFEPEFNVGLWTQFSLIKGSNLILELEPDDPIGQFNNMFWTSANDSISLSKKLTCWVLKGPTGQSSPGKATESRGVGIIGVSRISDWGGLLYWSLLYVDLKPF